MTADLSLFDKGQRVVSFSRLALREKATSRAVADDTLGASGAAVKPWKSIVGQIAPTYHVCGPCFGGTVVAARVHFMDSCEVANISHTKTLA